MIPSSVYYLLTIAASVAASPFTTHRSDESIVQKLIITADNTVNGTIPPEHPQIASNALKININIANNYDNERQMHAYVTGNDRGGHVVMLSTSGEFYYPNTSSEIPQLIPDDAKIAIPLNNRGSDHPTSLVIPDSIISGRVYIADGDIQFKVIYNKTENIISLVQPSLTAPDDASANIAWGFVELTNEDQGKIWANLSFVDWVSLVMGMRLTLGDGQVETVPGLEINALDSICDALDDQSARDQQPWDKLCVRRVCESPSCQNKILRILSPNLYTSEHHDWMADYYTAYVNDVYAKYTNEDLIIHTQSLYGDVPCRVQGGTQLVCQGDSNPFPKPTTSDIWGCNSGSFRKIDVRHDNIKARLCAAFTRTQLLLPGGNITPALGNDTYYTIDPTNHYSRIVHEYEIDGIGYAFAHDDVNPDGIPKADGTLTGPNPQLLEIFIGGGLGTL